MISRAESKLKLIYEEVKPLTGGVYLVRSKSMPFGKAKLVQIETGLERETDLDTKVKVDVLKEKHIIANIYERKKGMSTYLIDPTTLEFLRLGDRLIDKTNILKVTQGGKIGAMSISGKMLFPIEAENIIGITKELIAVIFPDNKGSYIVNLKTKSYTKIAVDRKIGAIEKSGEFLKIAGIYSISSSALWLSALADMTGKLLTPMAFTSISNKFVDDLGLIILQSPYNPDHRQIPIEYGIMSVDGEYMGGPYDYFEQIVWRGKQIAAKIPHTNLYAPSTWWSLRDNGMKIEKKITLLTEQDIHNRAEKIWVNGKGFIKE